MWRLLPVKFLISSQRYGNGHHVADFGSFFNRGPVLEIVIRRQLFDSHQFRLVIYVTNGLVYFHHTNVILNS